MLGLAISLGFSKQRGGGEEPEVVTGYSDSETQSLITAGYIPIADASDLHAIETGQKFSQLGRMTVYPNWSRAL